MNFIKFARIPSSMSCSNEDFSSVQMYAFWKRPLEFPNRVGVIRGAVSFDFS